MSLQLFLAMLFLPLFTAGINGIIGRKLPYLLSGSIASISVFISFCIALFIFFNLQEPVHYSIYNVFSWQKATIQFGFQIDALSSWMSLIITGIGCLIHLFSMGYIEDKNEFYKFFTYLNLFIFSMLLLVFGSNYFVMFFGWEGVGVCSFLLIGFNYSDAKKGLANAMAARKAFIMNRIGDAGLLIALFLLLNEFQTLEYREIYALIQSGEHQLSHQFYFGLSLSLFFAATGKSAQIPLFTWLPDAMAGPTPVSALIHAATMVTAGIFMVVRSNFIFELAPDVKEIILWIGLSTALIGAFIALNQNDIKKVLAYSTVSQLGLMFVALGCGAYTVAIFHVTTHAFFKALLFLCAGSIIHAMHHEQDIRKMGQLKSYMKITHLCFLIGTLAIIGFPFLSGFFSKDEIIAHAYSHHPIVFILTLFVVIMTAIYMSRLYYRIFWGNENIDEHTKSHLHESPWTMTLPLSLLAVGALLGGLLNLPSFMGGGHAHFLSHLLEHQVEGLDKIHHLALSNSISILLMVSSALIAIFALYFSYLKWGKMKNEISAPKTVIWQSLSANRLYIDELYNAIIVKPTEKIAAWGEYLIEKIILSQIIQWIGTSLQWSGSLLIRFQKGTVNQYIFWMIFATLLFFLYTTLTIHLWN